ncbi:MAG TPA: translocation/assembly module TamB domain-containing protein [Gemmatimonadaceae bacterium]|nr:translocation/assembly module TamB domain-containing protein [Gemmatimonadaceae bacterium]
MRRALRIIAGIVVAIIAVAGVGVWVLTGTGYGHERVRKIALDVLKSHVHGRLSIGRIDGNLLTGTTIHDISITDSSGAPFLVADAVKARYSIVALIGKKVALNDVTITRPVVVLDRPPGGKWNFDRIFPRTPSNPADTTHGFGSWISFTNVTIVDGQMVVKSPWRPDTALTAGQQDSVAALALGGKTRNRIQQVAGGYQKVMSFDRIDARMPRIRLADPAEPTKLMQVASLQMVAAPFLPPVAEVRDLKGTFEFTGDSLWWTKSDAKLPGSHITGDGRYVYASSDMTLRLHGAPVAAGDLRWLYPRLPANGGGSLDFLMTWAGKSQDYVATNADITLDGAHATGTFGLALGDSLAFHDTNLRVAGLDTRTIEQMVPGFTSPRRGTLGGRLSLAGGIHAMRLNSDITFADSRGGTSEVAAVGEVGMIPGGGFRARALQVRADPVQVALARTWMPSLPVGGIVVGTATVNGATTTRLVANGDLTHVENGARSRVTGTAAIRTAGAGGMWMDVDARARPVSLHTVGRFVPALELRGVAAGPIRLTGTLRDLAVRSSLRFNEGGELDVRGTLDLASTEKGYDLAAAMRLFDAHAVIARLPRTSITAKMTARGRGFSPATMAMAASADVAASQYDSLAIDSASMRVSIANGLLTARKLTLSGSRAVVSASGTFGLAEGRSGQLAVRGQLDSLQRFARFFPHDTGMVAPRPARVAKALAQAREDSVRLARATEVERAVTGAPMPKVKAQLPPSVRADSVSGHLQLAGTVTGGLSRFNVRARLAGEDFAAMGSTAKAARADIAWTNARTPQSKLAVGVQLDAASLKGFALDSVDTRLSYGNSAGEVDVAIWQDHVREYSLAGNYLLHLDEKELHLSRTQLRFDTTVWRGTREAAIRWGARGIEIRGLELRNSANGRIYANGLLPTKGDASLQFAIDNFHVEDIAGLLESDVPFNGILSASGRVDGTLGDPRFRVALGVSRASFRGTTIPELHGTLSYARRVLTTRMDASRAGGAAMASLTGQLPIDLSLQRTDTGSRLGRGAVALDLVADSLPLELIPRFTDVVAGVTGRAAGKVVVRGTMAKPQLAGALALDRGYFKIVSTGMQVRNVAGFVRMRDDTVFVDSIAGQASGLIRLTGTIGVEKFTNPDFDLHFFAQNARVLDNENGMLRADAELTMAGPMSAAYISGRTRVRSGVIYIPESDNKSVISAGDPALFNVIDTSVVTDREMLPTQSPLLSGLRMDVTLNVSRNTWVRSREANVEIYTADEGLSVHVDRSKQTLALDGVVSTDNGQYTFLTKRFTIKRGSAMFVGSNGANGEPMNPTLQITGEYGVQLPQQQALNIEVLIGGTLLRPKLTLQSDAQPPLSQSDLLSYLAFGRSSSSLLQLEGSSASSGNASGGIVGTGAAVAYKRLAAVAVGVVADQFEGEASRSLGADVFNITPSDVPTEVYTPNGISDFLVGTQVELGKYIDPRTYLSLRAAGKGYPGIGIRQRTAKGFIYELSFEPRFPVTAPSLDPAGNQHQFEVFGAFITREWRF